MSLKKLPKSGVTAYTDRHYEFPILVLANSRLQILTHPSTGQVLDIINLRTGRSHLSYHLAGLGMEEAGGLRLIRRSVLFAPSESQVKTGEEVYWHSWEHKIIREKNAIRLVMRRPIDVHSGTAAERRIAVEPEIELRLEKDSSDLEVFVRLLNRERDWPPQPFELRANLQPGYGGKTGAPGTGDVSRKTHILAGNSHFGPVSFSNGSKVLEVPGIGIINEDVGDWVILESDRPSTWVNVGILVHVAPMLPSSLGHSPPTHSISLRLRFGHGTLDDLRNAMPAYTPLAPAATRDVKRSRRSLKTADKGAGLLIQACLDNAARAAASEQEGDDLETRRWLDRAEKTKAHCETSEPFGVLYAPETFENMKQVDLSLWDTAQLRRAYEGEWPPWPAPGAIGADTRTSSATGGLVWAAWGAYLHEDPLLAKRLKPLLLAYADGVLEHGTTGGASIGASQNAAAIVRGFDILNKAGLTWTQTELRKLSAGLIVIGEWVWKHMHGWSIDEHKVEGGWTVNRGQKGFCYMANWKTMECFGLAAIARILPGYANARRWMDYTEEVYKAWFDGGLTKDSFHHVESSIGYHNWGLRFLYYMGVILEADGRPGVTYVSPKTGQSIATMAEFTTNMQSPEGRFAIVFGNGAHEIPATIFANIAKRFNSPQIARTALDAGWKDNNDMTEWGFVIESLPQGLPAPDNSPRQNLCLADSGVAIFRTGGITLAVNFGPYKSGHCHRVKLETQWWAGDTLISPQTCPYQNEPNAGLYRGIGDLFGITAFAKSCVTFDDVKQNPLGGGRLIDWKSDGETAKGTFGAPTYPKLEHQRTIESKNGSITFTDKLVGQGASDFEEATWRMNFLNRPQVSEDGKTATIKTGKWQVEARSLGNHTFHVGKRPSKYVTGFQLCSTKPARNGVTFKVRLKVISR
jgi:hypothetical protein